MSDTYPTRETMAELAMDKTTQRTDHPNVTIEDVKRVLEVGRLLLSVLTPEELEQLQQEMSNNRVHSGIGNAGVT